MNAFFGQNTGTGITDAVNVLGVVNAGSIACHCDNGSLGTVVGGWGGGHGVAHVVAGDGWHCYHSSSSSVVVGMGWRAVALGSGGCGGR